MSPSERNDKLSVFEQIKQGLEESIAHSRGELTLKTTELPEPPPAFTPKDVARIRQRANMSQAVFAAYLNVSPKTVQSWEQGARTPKAGEARLLQIMTAEPESMIEMIATEKVVRRKVPKMAGAKAAR